jgi:hypothetical protein
MRALLRHAKEIKVEVGLRELIATAADRLFGSDRFAVLRVITTRRLLDAARRPASGVGRCRSSGVPRVQLVNGRRDSVQPRMRMCRRRQLNPIAIEDFEWDWPLGLNPIAGSLLRKRLLQLECPWFESRCDGGISGAVSNKGMRQC